MVAGCAGWMNGLVVSDWLSPDRLRPIFSHLTDSDFAHWSDATKKLRVAVKTVSFGQLRLRVDQVRVGHLRPLPPGWPSRHLGFGETRNSALRSADLENPTVEPNMKWIGQPLAEIWAMAVWNFQNWEVGRQSVVGRSVLNTCISSSYTDLIYSSSLR